MQESRVDLTVIEGGKNDPEPYTANKPGGKAWASRLRSRAKELSKELDLGYMELARILYQVFDTPIDGDPNRGPLYINWGYTSFSEYAEKELGLHQKKAERLKLIWYTLEIQLKDMDPNLKERCILLGMSKVRELVHILTLRNAEYWITQAESMGYRKLFEVITDEKRRMRIDEAVLGSSGGTITEIDASSTDPGDLIPPVRAEIPKQKRFDLFPAQQENILLALKRASDITGSDKEGHLLDLICTDFIATNDTFGSDLDKRLRYVAKIERSLGLKLIAVDPDAKEIVYGLSTLQMLAPDADEAESA